MFCLGSDSSPREVRRCVRDRNSLTDDPGSVAEEEMIRPSCMRNTCVGKIVNLADRMTGN